MNRLDRALQYIAPTIAERRARSRLNIQALEQARSYYDGADTGRRGGSIRRSNASANAITQSKLPVLRKGSRDLVRNNPYAKRGVEAIISNVVGTGIIPRFKRGGRAVPRLERLKRQTLDTPIIDAAGQHDYYGLQSLALNAVVEGGEVLIVRQWTDSNLFPVQFQVLEPEHLDNSRDGVLKDGGRIVQGVEFDSTGRRRGYWIYPEHPGGVWMRNLQSVPFPAEDVAHIYRVDRPGQVRGIPWLAPIMLRIADFADYEEAQLLRQKIAACFAVFKSDPVDAGPSAQTDQTDDEEQIEPGMIYRIGGGSQVTFGDPPQVQDYADYAKVSLRALAAGLGVSYEALTGDLESVNFVSGRMGWLEFQRNIDRWRWNTLIPQGCGIMMRWWLEAAALTGARVDNVSVQHTPPRREMLQPEREVPAKERALSSGQNSLTQHVQETLGRDLDEYLDELSEERGMLAERGIQLSIFHSTEPSAVPEPNPDEDPE